jgi:hypothetical protein
MNRMGISMVFANITRSARGRHRACEAELFLNLKTAKALGITVPLPLSDAPTR